MSFFHFRTSLVLALALSFCLPAAALEQTVQSAARQANTLTLITDKGSVQLRFLTPEAVEVHYQPQGVQQLPSFSIAGGRNVDKIGLIDRDSRLEFGTPDLKVKTCFDSLYWHSPFRIRGRYHLSRAREIRDASS